MKRAFSYERVSSSKQAQTGGGLDRQGNAAALWCAANGYQLDQELDLSDPGRSAFHGHHLSRGALGQFLSLAQAGQLGDAPILLVEAIDRLSRQEPLDALETILQGLVGSGVQVVTLEDQATYSRETLRTDPTKLILLVLKVQAAHEYSARLSMRMQASWEQIREKAALGKNRSGARRPFWIDYDPAGDAFKLNDKAEIIRRMYDLLEQGNGLALTAKQLNAEGFRTPSGKPWDPGAMQWILRSEAVYGTVKFLRRSPEPIRVPDYYPAAVSQERVEEITRMRRARVNEKSMLGRKDQTYWIGQALSRCSCGSPLAAYSSIKMTKRDGRVKRLYLQCKRARYKADAPVRETCLQGMIHIEPVMFHVLTRMTVSQLQILFEGNSKSQSELQKELKARQKLDGDLLTAREEVAQAQQKVKQGAKTGVDLSLLALLNDAAEEAKARVGELEQALAGVIDRLDLLQRRPNAEAAAAELNPAVADLLRSLAKREDTPEQRRALNALLRKLQFTIHVDARGKRCGLQIRDGEIDWQPVLPGLVANAIGHGPKAVGGKYLEIEDPELAQLIGAGNSVSIRIDESGNYRIVVIDSEGNEIEPQPR